MADPNPVMTPSIDESLAAFQLTRAALTHDQVDDATAQAALATATANAQATAAKVAADVVQYNGAIDVLVSALTAAKIAV